VQLCYVDEAGSSELCTVKAPDSSPLLALAGLIVAEPPAKQLAWNFLKLKKEFRPHLASDKTRLSEVIRTEVKGSDLRADIRASSRRRRRAAFGFIDSVLELLEGSNCTVIGEVIVKPAEQGLRDEAVYPDSIANMAQAFNSHLAAASTTGMMILDSRTKWRNVGSVHGITTRKFTSGGDKLAALAEAPVFGHSDAHVLLQVADIIVSAVVYPMGCAAFCEDLEWNTHAHERYDECWNRYGARLRNLEYRYVDASGERRGGFRVRDHRRQRQSHRLFVPDRPPRPVPPRAYLLPFPEPTATPPPD
jgi:hypothetical protein